MTAGVSSISQKVRGRSRLEVGSRVEAVTSLRVPPERAWEALRDFDSKSTKGLLSILHQETNRLLVYEVTGLPKTVKSMIGEIHLQPDGGGTRLSWSIRFSTKPTMFARFLRPLIQTGITRTLRASIRSLHQKLTNEN